MGNKSLEARGKNEQTEGKVQTKFSDTKKNLGNLKRDLEK